MVKVREDMTGWVMSEHGVPDSRLTVLKQAEDYVKPNGQREARWLCQCDCPSHNQVVVLGFMLKNGTTKSCGCLQKEIITKLGKENFKGNSFDISGEYGVLWETNTNKEVYFDLFNAGQILKHTWWEGTDGYPCAKINNKVVRMHVFLGYPYHDHEDRNKKNNIISNLRPCTQQENCRNITKRKGCTSEYIGVYQLTKTKEWRAHIQVDKKKKSLGTFQTEKEALIARLKAEKQYFGEFAPQKELFKKYGI